MTARATVPQHLELDDVVAWGLGAADLLCVAAGCAAGWWSGSSIDASLPVRVALAVPPCLIGFVLAVVRVEDRRGRDWVALIAGYVLRPRILVVGRA